MSILRFVDLAPLFSESFLKLLNTKSIVKGWEKNVVCDFLAYKLMHASPMSP